MCVCEGLCVCVNVCVHVCLKQRSLFRQLSVYWYECCISVLCCAALHWAEATGSGWPQVPVGGAAAEPQQPLSSPGASMMQSRAALASVPWV